MTSPYDGTPVLTVEQRAVVEQPVETLTLVTAAAGAGKTHTLIRRLDRLVEGGDVAPRDVLALSFSRASVRELRRRLAGHGDAGRVRAQTFDSWALDLLVQVDAGRDWTAESFDERIRAARAAIEEGKADELYEELRHVLVDEVQDLMAARRELVETLLERFDCGFTVVGDPAQAIYGFQVEDSAERASETNRFFDRLRSTFGEELVELHLTGNFRAATDEARIALPYGPLLRDGAERADHEDEMYETLRAELRGALAVGGLDDDFMFMLETSADDDTTTAVLCRDNGQALQLSERLHAAEVPHRLQRGAEERVVPAWLARLFQAGARQTVTRSAFDALAAEHVGRIENPSESWRALSSIASGRNGGGIELGRLRTAVATGRLPDELTAAPPAPLVVSSFHRAKGLEFDRVLVADPGPLRSEQAHAAAEEARLLYVAMTRPRTELMRMDPIGSWNVRLDKGTGRWARYGRESWKRLGMQMIGGDVHTDDPAGTAEFDADPVELQKHLATDVSAGDPIVLSRLHEESLEEHQSPPYLVMHSGRAIGIASERFRRDLYRLLKLNKGYEPRNFPYEITGVRVEAIQTVAGSPAAGRIAGLGEHGVWLAPFPAGLGRFHYRGKEAEA